MLEIFDILDDGLNLNHLTKHQDTTLRNKFPKIFDAIPLFTKKVSEKDVGLIDELIDGGRLMDAFDYMNTKAEVTLITICNN